MSDCTLFKALLTTHYSLLTTHYSPLTTHYSLLTTHYSPLTTHYSLLTPLGLTGERLRQRIFELSLFTEELKQRLIKHKLAIRKEEDTRRHPVVRFIRSMVNKLFRRKQSSNVDSSGTNGSMFSRNDLDVDAAAAALEAEGCFSDNDVSGQGVSTTPGHVALIVDGTSLEGIWASDDLQQRFTAAARYIPTVIACRVSPLQKAALVRMVKMGSNHPVTLAIGDGANDVGMIHEARVGVGISGKEGKHAANSADFAIGQFRFLVPMLLEHGRYNYIRCSKLVLYSFFKNMVLVSTLFYYCMYSAFSGSMPIDSIVFGGYNFYLGMPIVLLGAFDADVPRDAGELVLS